MRAFLLAAGTGTRLRPLTDRTPKCLVPIAGRPLLAYWFDLMAMHGIDQVLINTHHLAEEVATFVRDRRPGIAVTLAHEPKLFGSAGTVHANQHFVKGESEFLIMYADNLTDINLTELLSRHRQAGQLATLAIFRTPVPRECGIVVVDANGIVVGFEEKPARPASNLAFAGVIAASSALLEAIPDHLPCDLGAHVLPRLTGRMAYWEVDGYLRDIGTIESWERAQEEVGQLRRIGR